MQLKKTYTILSRKKQYKFACAISKYICMTKHKRNEGEHRQIVEPDTEITGLWLRGSVGWSIIPYTKRLWVRSLIRAHT